MYYELCRIPHSWLPRQSRCHSLHRQHMLDVEGLKKGYSSKPDTALILLAFWIRVVLVGARPYFEYVCSACNIVDLPSRDRCDEVTAVFPRAEIVRNLSKCGCPHETCGVRRLRLGLACLQRGSSASAHARRGARPSWPEPVWTRGLVRVRTSWKRDAACIHPQPPTCFAHVGGHSVVRPFQIKGSRTFWRGTSTRECAPFCVPFAHHELWWML